MKLSEIKKHLGIAETITFQLPDGSFVPASYHVTEVGIIEKNFIDCGGKIRKDRMANFQLWEGEDTEHRLKPEKFIKIIELSEKMLSMEDLVVEVEYQTDTIGKYGIDFNNGVFMLTNKHTDCLAKDACGVPENKQKVSLSGLGKTENACCTTASPGKCC